MQLAVFDFGGTLLVFEVAGLCGKSAVDGKKFPRKVDNEFYLEEGTIIGGKFYPKGSDKGEAAARRRIRTRPPATSSATSSTACAAATSEELNADILEAHYSSALCHLGNISYRLGEQVPGSTAPEASPPSARPGIPGPAAGKPEGSRRAGPEHDHLPAWREAGVRRRAEKFVGNDDANALFTRDYREPFVVTKVA